MVDADLTDTIRGILREELKAALQSAKKSKARYGKLGYTESEAADVIGVPMRTIQDARRNGRINAARIGKHWIISRKEIDRMLREGLCMRTEAEAS